MKRFDDLGLKGQKRRGAITEPENKYGKSRKRGGLFPSTLERGLILCR